jgi:hypothetical protein
MSRTISVRESFCRHDNCDFNVEYVCEKIKQNVWSKKRSEHSAEERKSRIVSDKKACNQLLLEDRQAKEPGIAADKKNIDFYTRPRYAQIVPKQYAEWIGDNKYHQLMEDAPDEEAKKYIRTAYRKSAIIADGGTVAIRKFEKATGLSCGRNGRDHSVKTNQLINLINNSIRKITYQYHRKSIWRRNCKR